MRRHPPRSATARRSSPTCGGSGSRATSFARRFGSIRRSSFMSRDATEDVELRDKHVKPGEIIFVSPWLIQRHTKLWDRPDVFDPDRFSDPASKESQRARLSSLQRRPARLPRRFLRDAGGHSDPRLPRAAFPLRAGGGPHAEADREADASLGKRRPAARVQARRGDRGPSLPRCRARPTPRAAALSTASRSASRRSAPAQAQQSTADKRRRFGGERRSGKLGSRLGDVAGCCDGGRCCRRASVPATARSIPSSVKKLPFTCALARTTLRNAVEELRIGRGLLAPEAIERRLEGQAGHVEDGLAEHDDRALVMQRRQPGRAVDDDDALASEKQRGQVAAVHHLDAVAESGTARDPLRLPAEVREPVVERMQLDDEQRVRRRAAGEGFQHDLHDVRHRPEAASGWRIW